MVSAPEIGLAWLAGSLTTLNPCVFPLLPLVHGGAVQSNRLAPVAMGAGMVSTFALLGLLVGVAGDALGLDPDHIRTAGALLLVVFGTVMLVPWLNERFTHLMTPMASSANSASTRFDAGSLGGAFAIGGLLGMVWSPCSGPILASALTIVAAEGGALRGTLVLGVFGLGTASVLAAAAYASRAGFVRARLGDGTHGWDQARFRRARAGPGPDHPAGRRQMARGATAAGAAARLDRRDHTLLNLRVPLACRQDACGFPRHPRRGATVRLT